MAKYPKGIPFIIGNEAAERYSFYGMKAIFVVFLTTFITNRAGQLDLFNEPDAKFWLHMFVFATYGFSIIGAFVSDILWGKYKTIITLSIVYCLGHFVLAFFEFREGFFLGCALIAIGSGGIKPCVSAHVGDQFDDSNAQLIEKMYNWFYFSINAGAIIAYLAAEPLLQNEYLQSKGINGMVAFGLPGVLMLIATIVFWLGRNKFVHVPPAGWALYSKELFGSKGLQIFKNLLPVYAFLAVFWSLFDQTSGAWVLQAKSDLMDKTIHLGFFNITVYPSQLGFLNSLLILVFIPLFSYIVYPFLSKFIQLNYIRKIAMGMVLAAVSFGIIGWVQLKMDQGTTMNIAWQVLAYVFLTAAEIMVSIPSLEFSYTQAPNAMKSFILSFWLLAVAVGNLFTAGINDLLNYESIAKILDGANYYWFFTGLMIVAAVLFYLVNKNYKEVIHIQKIAD